MLSGPRALVSASEAASYMLHEYLVRNDDAHRTANHWHGRGAAALGLPQRVSRRRFVSILEGRVPGTDIRLGRVVDGEHQHRPGWDATFSAPKSVSLEALLYGDRAVLRVHGAAVRTTLGWVEAEFLQTRGSGLVAYWLRPLFRRCTAIRSPPLSRKSSTMRSPRRAWILRPIWRSGAE